MDASEAFEANPHSSQEASTKTTAVDPEEATSPTARESVVVSGITEQPQSEYGLSLPSSKSEPLTSNSAGRA